MNETSMGMRLESGPVRVEYTKAGDRWSHSLGLVEGSIYQPILTSIEGTSSEDWPASTPVQQVVRDFVRVQAMEVPVLLGVGLSGNGHWSIAVESIDGLALKFDVACKTSKGAKRLGSEYRIDSQWELSSIGRDQAVLAPTQANSSWPELLLTVAHGRIVAGQSGGTLLIEPVSELAVPSTHRWCYQCSVRASEKGVRYQIQI